MRKVYLICGKICSGKSYYAQTLKSLHNAVILSTDEVTYDLIDNAQGDSYDDFASRVNKYLAKKAVEICKAGANVILDWGFWRRSDRASMSDFLASHGIDYEWHYVDVSDDIWRLNIARRNQKVQEGKGGSDFFVDDGLLEKVITHFEIPSQDEIDVWHTVNIE